MSSRRTLTCTQCHARIGVYELPRRFLDPDLFVCGRCLQPDPNPQLQLDTPPDETRRYDPAIAAIPF